MLTIRHDSTQIERLVTANDNPSYRMQITSSMTGRHLRWRVVRIKLSRVDLTTSTTPPSQTLAEYFLSLLQIDFRYAFPSVLQIDIRYDGSFDSSRFDNIFNLLSQTLADYFLSLLQIDFRYAFPCFERWFLRTPVSQHHLAANRFPVWWFAAVWVYWTTLLS